MEYAFYRGQKCRHCKEVIPVFSLGHHKPEEEGEDEFTKCVINFYKYGNVREKNYLLQKLINLFKERFEGDVKLDLLCIIPTHEKNKVNSFMKDFAQEFSKAISVEYKQIIQRTREVRSQHELRNSDERLENVKDSLEVVSEVVNKNILVLDNLSITGANVQEVFDALKKAGAKNVYFLCFGLGSKGKEADFDINPYFKGKASFITANWHWPKVSRDKRREYASQRKNLVL